MCSATLNTLAGLVVSFSRKVTRATVADITETLAAISTAWLSFAHFPHRMQSLHNLDNFLEGRAFTDPFFIEYLPDNHAPNTIEAMNALISMTSRLSLSNRLTYTHISSMLAGNANGESLPLNMEISPTLVSDRMNYNRRDALTWLSQRVAGTRIFVDDDHVTIVHKINPFAVDQTIPTDA